MTEQKPCDRAAQLRASAQRELLAYRQLAVLDDAEGAVRDARWRHLTDIVEAVWRRVRLAEDVLLEARRIGDGDLIAIAENRVRRCRAAAQRVDTEAIAEQADLLDAELLSRRDLREQQRRLTIALTNATVAGPDGGGPPRPA